MVNLKIEDQIAILSIDLKDISTNVINEHSMNAFGEAFEKALASDIKGIIITSNKKDFLVGADLNMIIKLTTAEQIMALTAQLNGLFRKVETCGKPVVAAINGNALGGGYELCLACHYRIAVNTKNLQIGLPEVMLGLLPGAGGTQRLPRLIGMQSALQMMLEGKKVRAKEALAAGMVNEVVKNQEDLIPAAKKWILEKGDAVQPWDKKGFKIPGGAPISPEGGMIFTAGSALLRKKTYGNYPAAQAILSCVFEGLQMPLDRGLIVESRYFAQCALSKESKSMIRTLWFSLNDANKGEARPKDVLKSDLKKVGILGAGMMGAGIAYVSANAGLDVVLKDVSLEGAEKGKNYSREILAKKVKKGFMSQDEMDAFLAKIQTTDNPADLKGCDLVVEAVFEDRALKAKVTQESEAVIENNAVFATNTSTLPITGLAKASTRPDNFIGLHFFSPVDKMPLVEIILGEKTSKEALAISIDYLKMIKKTPIVVNDGRGFYTSRVFATYVKEGMALLEEGVLPSVIENAGKAAGMPVAPLALTDEVSLELIYHIIKQTEIDLNMKADEPAARITDLFVEKLNRPGKKAKKGFYEYPEDGKKFLWPELKNHFNFKEDAVPYEDIQKRLLYIQVLETIKCMDEGIVTKPQDADVGSIMGWGFAPFTGGVISYIDFVGIENFVAECERLEKTYGIRFTAPSSLKERAKNKLNFY